MLLYKYGGIYLDADIIILKNIKYLLKKLDKYDYIGFGCTGYVCFDGYGKPSNWMMISRPNTILMKNVNYYDDKSFIETSYLNNTYSVFNDKSENSSLDKDKEGSFGSILISYGTFSTNIYRKFYIS
jgi:hypothetical protein